MTYWSLNAFFLGAAAVVGCIALAGARGRGRESREASGRSGLEPAGLAAATPAALLLSAGILVLVSAVFDNVMIGMGLVGYDSRAISGAFIGLAPLEDFAYPVAAVVLLPSLWMLLPNAKERRA